MRLRSLRRQVKDNGMSGTWHLRDVAPISLKQGNCHPWTLVDRWDVPDDDKFTAMPEVDYLCFIAGIVDAIERADCWNEFIIESVPGKAPERGSPYRNSTISGAEPDVEDD